MLVRNEPEKGLQPHQLAAYRAVRRGFKEKRKASVIMPTGCGKSFVALQAMLDYKDDNILITVPTIVIKNQYYEYIAKYIVGEEPTPQRTARNIAEEFFPHLKIITYAAIERSNPEVLKKLDPKFVINDEAHKADADKTSKKMELLFNSFPDAYWLGITATPERMDGKNVVDHFYEGTIDYELTLEEALRRRIVKEPFYVPCAYALSDKLEDVKKAINECTNPQKRAKLEELYEKMRSIVANAEGVPELITNNIQVKDGKVIVFCKDKEHMDELMAKASEWFGQIDSEPEIYSLYSGDGYTTQENIETLRNFKKSKSKHLKILYTIDMLNEGIHTDVDTIIMARPTESKIVYGQQLGRGLSSDPDANPTTIIDLVNNYLNFDLDRTINQVKGTSSTSKEDDDRADDGDLDTGDDDEYIPVDCFKITGVMREFLDLLEEVNQISYENRYVRFAEEIYTWVMEHKKFPSSSTLGSQEEQELCAKYYRLKYRYIDRYLNLESDDEKEQFKKDNPRIDDVIQMMQEACKYDIPVQLRNAYNILDWMSTMKHPVTPKEHASDPTEKSLGYAFGNLKTFVKNYKKINDEEKKKLFENKYPEIFEIISILEVIEDMKTPMPICQALDIREWVESQSVPRKPVESKPEEHDMARQINSLRTGYITRYMNLTTEEERAAFRQKYPFIDRLKEIIDDIDSMCTREPIRLTQIKEIKSWMNIKNNGKRPSTVAEDKEEARLGQCYSDIQKKVKKYRTLTDEKEKKKYEEEHPEIIEIVEIYDWIDENTISEVLENARAIEAWALAPNHQRLPRKQLTNKGTFKEGYEDSPEMQEEHVLGKKLNGIRSEVIKKICSIQNPEEREAYFKKRKDDIRVLAIINELDLRLGNARQRALAELIHQDRDLHERLQAALALEKEYQARTKQEQPKENGKQGVDIDEQ